MLQNTMILQLEMLQQNKFSQWPCQMSHFFQYNAYYDIDLSYGHNAYYDIDMSN